MAIDKSLLAGSTALLILTLLSEQDMYGYQMTATLKERSENVFDLKAGTLYPLLHQLEQSGCIQGYDALTSGRTRRYYHITDAGREQLSARRAEWKAYSGAVNAVMGGVSYAN